MRGDRVPPRKRAAQAVSELGPGHGPVTLSPIPSGTSQAFACGERVCGPRGSGWAGTQWDVCRVLQVGAPPPAAAAHGQLRPGGPVRRGRAHTAPGVLLCGDPGQPTSELFCSRGGAGPGPWQSHRPWRRSRCGLARGTGRGATRPPPAAAHPSPRAAWAGRHSRVQSRVQGRVESECGLSLCLPPDPQVADGTLTNQLALLLLERSDSLYQVAEYEARVHRWALPRAPPPPGFTAPHSACLSSESPPPPHCAPFQLPSSAQTLRPSIPSPPPPPSPAAARTPLSGPERPHVRSSSPRSVLSCGGPSPSSRILPDHLSPFSKA